MKILLFAALFAAVTAKWQQGYVYKYNVSSHTLASLQKGSTSGAVLQATLLLRPQDDDRVQVKLENTLYAQVHDKLDVQNLTSGLSFKPIEALDQVAEVQFSEGRVKSFKIPQSMSLVYENLFKGLIGNLQMDTTTYRRIKSDHEYYDDKTQQGQFRKMEEDVTGDCETLYTVLPLAGDWKREMPHLSQPDSQIIEISKVKNYGNCVKQISYHFGVPHNADWSGSAKHHHDEVFMKRTTVSRIITNRDRVIYKSETKSSVYANPLMYGKQNAEVVSNVALTLESVVQENKPQWEIENPITVNSLLYSISRESFSSESPASLPVSKEQTGEGQKRKQRSLDRPLTMAGYSNERGAKYHPRNIGGRTQKQNNQKYDGDRPLAIPGAGGYGGHENNMYNPRNGDDRPLAIPGVGGYPSNVRNPKEDNVHAYSGSSSSSSSEESSGSYDSNDNIPNLSDPAFAAVFMLPYSQEDNNDTYQSSTQKLVQEIAQEIQNPNNIPKSDTLAKINILMRNIALMNFEQITQVSRSIEMGQGSSNKVKSDMWMVFRDAVAQTGTLPAFQQVRSWIRNQKLQNEEAAEVLSSLVYTLRYPTKEVMIQLFSLATESQIRQQPHLNTTALLSATKLINLGHVNQETAHSRYPSHMYGRLTSEKDQFIEKQILPVLEQDLKKAIEEGDSHKSQVYIRAIGNLGHRGIIDVFKPYLEGSVQVSTYLRALMVDCLDMLAWQRDHQVRSVLYNLLRNTGEPYEVRVGAILNIFKAHPTQSMMYGMAELTHNDPCMHVRAAIKAGITSTAKLENSRFLTMAKIAQEAEPMLTKEEFGVQYAGRYVWDHWDQERHWGNLRYFAFASSEVSFLPKYIDYGLWNKFGGWMPSNRISYGVSDFQELMNNIWKALRQQQAMNLNNNPKFKYTVKQIADMLNLKLEPTAPFEAYFQFDFMNDQRFYTFSKYDIEQLPKFIGEQISKFANGIDFHYTKVLNHNQVSIMFPIAMGVPFVYKYKQPTLIHLQGNAKGSMQRKPQLNGLSANLQKEIQVTIARDLHGSVGFLDTLSGVYSSAGVVNKFLVNLPLKTQLQIESGKFALQLEPLRPDQDTTLSHFSVWPYTSIQEMGSQVTVAHDPTTKVIKENSRYVSMDNKFGLPSSGMQFHFQGYSHSEDYINIGKMLQGQDWFTAITSVLHQKDIALTHFNFKYLGQESTTKSVVLDMGYGKVQKYEQNSSVSNEKLEIGSVHDIPCDEKTRQTILDKVSSGIPFAETKYVDLRATFNGGEKLEYALITAMADSLVHPNIQYILYGNRNNNIEGKLQVSAVGTVVKPEISTLSFSESLKRDVKVDFEFDVKSQREQNVGELQFKGYKLRTKELVEELKNSELGKTCMEQMAQGNYYQLACHEMIVRAHALDQITGSVSYKNVTPATKIAAHQIYRFLRYFGFWYVDENISKYNQDEKIDFECKGNYTENKMNCYMITRIGELQLRNVPIPKYTGKLFSVYPVLTPMERVFNSYSNYQYQPFCTIDENKIDTFSNREVSYELNTVSHVVMNGFEGWESNDRQLSVLARKTPEKQLEATINYRSNYRQSLGIELKPAPKDSGKLGVVLVNSAYRKISGGNAVVYRDEETDQNILEQYVLSDGVLFLNVDEGVLRVIFDGQRLVVLPSAFRNKTSGLCGKLSGEVRDDYLTPQGFVSNPQLFGASYALTAEAGDDQIEALQQQLPIQAYTPQHVFTSIMRSNDQWKAPVGSSSSSSSSSSSEENTPKVFKSKSYRDDSGCEIVQQIQFFDLGNQLCVTEQPIPSCTRDCEGYDFQEIEVAADCKPKDDRQFRIYRQQILLGQNPIIEPRPRDDVVHVMFKVPKACKPL